MTPSRILSISAATIALAFAGPVAAVEGQEPRPVREWRVIEGVRTLPDDPIGLAIRLFSLEGSLAARAEDLRREYLNAAGRLRERVEEEVDEEMVPELAGLLGDGPGRRYALLADLCRNYWEERAAIDEEARERIAAILHREPRSIARPFGLRMALAACDADDPSRGEVECLLAARHRAIHRAADSRAKEESGHPEEGDGEAWRGVRYLFEKYERAASEARREGDVAALRTAMPEAAAARFDRILRAQRERRAAVARLRERIGAEFEAVLGRDRILALMREEGSVRTDPDVPAAWPWLPIPRDPFAIVRAYFPVDGARTALVEELRGESRRRRDRRSRLRVSDLRREYRDRVRTLLSDADRPKYGEIVAALDAMRPRLREATAPYHRSAGEEGLPVRFPGDLFSFFISLGDGESMRFARGLLLQKASVLFREREKWRNGRCSMSPASWSFPVQKRWEIQVDHERRLLREAPLHMDGVALARRDRLLPLWAKIRRRRGDIMLATGRRILETLGRSRFPEER